MSLAVDRVSMKNRAAPPVSEALLPEVEANPGLEVLAPPAPLQLDDAGHLGPAFLVK